MSRLLRVPGPSTGAKRSAAEGGAGNESYAPVPAAESEFDFSILLIKRKVRAVIPAATKWTDPLKLERKIFVFALDRREILQ